MKIIKVISCDVCPWFDDDSNSDVGYCCNMDRDIITKTPEWCPLEEVCGITGLMLDNAPLNFPSAKYWMWNYCVYLGPYTSTTGVKYDLGVYFQPGKGDCSAAIVYGDIPGQYLSGEFIGDNNEVYKETYRRAKELQLI